LFYCARLEAFAGVLLKIQAALYVMPVECSAVTDVWKIVVPLNCFSIDQSVWHNIPEDFNL
jgi:hypothetical protein